MWLYWMFQSDFWFWAVRKAVSSVANRGTYLHSHLISFQSVCSRLYTHKHEIVTFITFWKDPHSITGFPWSTKPIERYEQQVLLVVAALVLNLPCLKKEAGLCVFSDWLVQVTCQRGSGGVENQSLIALTIQVYLRIYPSNKRSSQFYSGARHLFWTWRMTYFSETLEMFLLGWFINIKMNWNE